MSRIVVLVSGRGSNLQALIDAKNAGAITSDIALVISNKENAYAIERARLAGISTQVIVSKNQDNNSFFAQVLAAVQQQNPNWIVLAGFMKILPKDFVQVFPNRIINIHPSLLPQFPGLNAQQQALTAQATETGCTVHFVDEGCDTGPIILQKRLPIFPSDTVDSLASRLLPLEHACLVEAVQLLEARLLKG